MIDTLFTTVIEVIDDTFINALFIARSLERRRPLSRILPVDLTIAI